MERWCWGWRPTQLLLREFGTGTMLVRHVRCRTYVGPIVASIDASPPLDRWAWDGRMAASLIVPGRGLLRS